ncbi:MAG: aspartyl-tRNA synthetase [Thermoleophilaceae bacterium]|jgi:aspartyl-tRNA synthetase|nr:aspartyl-tRNA synthetase [Thermoleophilaceae bacterium]
MRQEARSNSYRSIWSGHVRADHVGQELRVAGWVHRNRDHGGVIFIDLRDRSGLVQLVFHPGTDAHDRASRLRSEDVISAFGPVVAREERNVNPNMPTGEVEIDVSEFDLLADSETPPFPVDDDSPVGEDTRLRYRYIDLRRENMVRSLELRHEVVQAIRSHMHDHDFLEIETPILTKSTPEGARDYLVPSRVQRGQWYALPQSPQLFKQILMISGYERYYQIARCFRDEDLRADRQPEFTQLDVEMSFVEEEDVMSLVDDLLVSVFRVAGVEVPTPIERLTYDEAMLRYGTDRPDRRIGMEIQDLTDVFAGSGFNVFASAPVVRGIKAGGEFTRKRFDELTEQAKALGAKGLVWAVLEEGGAWRSPISKFLSEDEMNGAALALGAGVGDVLFLVADDADVAARVLGGIRSELGAGKGEGHDLLWVTHFPMFEWDEEGHRFAALHHPFTAPTGDLDGDPATWKSRAYDIVMDGTEIGGGSIRINTPEVQQKVFKAIGFDEAEAKERFGFLLEALDYGAPPHGGIAFGLDRIVALLAGKDSIRDVMAFPKTATASDLMTGAPSEVDTTQLRELGIRLA